MKQHNSKNDASYNMGINRFSDMTFEEYQQLLGLKANGTRTRKHENGENSFIVFNTTDLPASVDWRNTGAVTKVKDQGSCGSCYAFSAVASIEGQYFLKTNKSLELSVEQVVECSDSY
jgi:C1A family cysteine protease